MTDIINLPGGFKDFIKDTLDEDNSKLVLEEIEKTINLEGVVPPNLDNTGRTRGNWNTMLPDLNQSNEDHRQYEALSYETIDEMMKSSAVVFALEMKRSQIISVFRNERSWRIHTEDKELRSIVEANLAEILSKMADDFSYSAMVYGTSFQELLWEQKSKYELGVTNSKFQQNRKFIVAKLPNSVDPKTVRAIRRTPGGEQNGFIQSIDSEDIIVPRESSLIIPYADKFRNLWGQTFFRAIYPLWFWYEIILRSMVRFTERIGTPVAVVKAPSKSTVLKPGTTTRVSGMDWAMEIASNISRSNAATVPSDTDDSGKPLWSIDYLSSTEKSQPFVEILELITQMILRAGLNADRALSQSSGGTGSYNIGTIHQQATAVHNELILLNWVYYLDKYFLPFYSLYNRGVNGPKISIETQGLDPADRQNFNSLMGIAAQDESFKDSMYMIDWDTLFETNNIPVVSREEAAKRKQKLHEENLQKQKDFMENGPQSQDPQKQADINNAQQSTENPNSNSEDKDDEKTNS